MMEIKVGILTDGMPHVIGGRVTNALMGSGFHWQQRYELELPAEAKVLRQEEGRQEDGRQEEGCQEVGRQEAGRQEDGRKEAEKGETGLLVVRMPLETYLASVVGSEMNPLAPSEFLRAHAIVSRSWAVGKVLGLHSEDSLGRLDNADEVRSWADTGSHCGFDVCSDDHCQRYQGVQPLSASARSALASTAGLVLVDAAGQVIDARFSKCCGGRTELFSTCWQDRDYPYLVVQDDPWCNPDILTAEERERLVGCMLKDYDVRSTPAWYLWEERVKGEDIEQRLRERFGRDIGRITGLRALARGGSGRIHRLEVTGSGRRLVIGKELAVRRLLGATHLLSSAFSVTEYDGEMFHLRGRGWGHGVGLCQIGAAVMAMRGYSAEEILEFYYPGTSLRRLQ